MPSITKDPTRVRRAAPSPGQLPYGAAQTLNAARPVTKPVPPELAQAAQPRPAPMPAGAPPQQNTGFEDILFAPTDRPHEPITAGAPFGPGPSFTRYAHESDEDFKMRVAAQLLSSPVASSRVKSFATRILMGE